MLVSKKQGAKYGLIQPKQKTAVKPVQTTLAAFADADEEPEQRTGVAQDIARQAAKKRQDAKVAAQQAAALKEDPSAFDYDSVYDSIQEKRVQPQQAEKLERKSRYIDGLLSKAKEREREQDIVYERRLAKERQAEDHLFGDKDRFVTAAYKRKLEEDQKWLAEEKLREQLEAREDVVKKGHMGEFYSNLMSNNVAFGTASARQRPPADGQQPSTDAASSANPEHRAPPADEQAPRPPVPSSQQDGLRGPEASAKQPGAPLAQLPGTSADRPARQEAVQEASGSAQQAQGGEAAALPVQQPQAEGMGQEEAQPQPSREDKLASARDRYLARKRKAPDL